ncbi:hypothetical protein HDU76_005838, partial [Blyttiomyces sp. JEL0837]
MEKVAKALALAQREVSFMEEMDVFPTAIGSVGWKEQVRKRLIKSMRQQEDQRRREDAQESLDLESRSSNTNSKPNNVQSQSLSQSQSKAPSQKQLQSQSQSQSTKFHQIPTIEIRNGNIQHASHIKGRNGLSSIETFVQHLNSPSNASKQREPEKKVTSLSKERTAKPLKPATVTTTSTASGEEPFQIQKDGPKIQVTKSGLKYRSKHEDRLAELQLKEHDQKMKKMLENQERKLQVLEMAKAVEKANKMNKLLVKSRSRLPAKPFHEAESDKEPPSNAVILASKIKAAEFMAGRENAKILTQNNQEKPLTANVKDINKPESRITRLRNEIREELRQHRRLVELTRSRASTLPKPPNGFESPPEEVLTTQSFRELSPKRGRSRSNEGLDDRNADVNATVTDQRKPSPAKFLDSAEEIIKRFEERMETVLKEKFVQMTNVLGTVLQKAPSGGGEFSVNSQDKQPVPTSRATSPEKREYGHDDNAELLLTIEPLGEFETTMQPQPLPLESPLSAVVDDTSIISIPGYRNQPSRKETRPVLPDEFVVRLRSSTVTERQLSFATG